MVWHHEGVSETKVFVHNELKIAHCNTAMSNKYTPFQSDTLQCLFQAHTHKTIKFHIALRNWFW